MAWLRCILKLDGLEFLEPFLTVGISQSGKDGFFTLQRKVTKYMYDTRRGLPQSLPERLEICKVRRTAWLGLELTNPKSLN